MLIKYWFLKNNHLVKKDHLNTLLDMMIIITLYHYLITALQVIGYVNILKVIKPCLFKVSDKKLLKKVHQNMGKNYHLNEKRI